MKINTVNKRITINKAAEMLRVKPPAILRLIAARTISARKTKYGWFIDAASVTSYLTSPPSAFSTTPLVQIEDNFPINRFN